MPSNINSFVFGGSENDPFSSQHPYSWNPSGSFGYGTAARGNATTPIGAASQALPFNLGQSKNLGALSDIINSINVKAQQTANAARIPNATALETKSSANIGSELAGQVPQDVLNLLQQQGAERGAATGQAPGSPNAQAAYLRALGLTSLGQEQLGQQNLTSAEGRNPGAKPFDPTSQLLTPEGLAQLNLGYLNAGNRNQPTGGGGYGGVRAPIGYGGGDTTNYGITEPGEVAGGANVPPATATAPTFSSPWERYLTSIGGPFYNAAPGSGAEGGVLNYSPSFQQPDEYGPNPEGYGYG